MNNTDGGPPWTVDRYTEVDHVIVRRCWRNSIRDVQSDLYVNVNTDHHTIIANRRQTLKARDTPEAEDSIFKIPAEGLTTEQLDATKEKFNKQIR